MGGKIYCTTDSYGVISFDIKTKKTESIVLASVPEKEFFYVIEKGENNNLFLGGTNKIVVYNTNTKNTSITPIGDLTVYAITQNGGLFWIGTNKGLRCAKYTNGQFRWITIPSIYNKSVRNVVFDSARNKIWLGTEEDGLLIVDSKTFAFTQKKNPLLKNIATITNDQKGKMWVSTFNGIAIFDLNNNKTYQLSQRNGLGNLEYNYKSAALLTDGTMLFGGLNGYDRIDFNQLQANVNESSRIHITGIKKNKTINQPFSYFENYTNQKTIGFNSGKEDLTILLSDLDITSSFGSFFTYQVNTDKPVLAFNNSIKISNLPYGDYSLIIYMYDNFGNLKDKKQLTIHAIVPFYYHLSFYIGLLLLLLLFGSISIYNIRKANKTEELVKDRIAMDLHDEVGTVLTRMLMTANSKKEVAQQQAELKQGITEALFSIRTSIHALSGSKTTIEDLIDDTLEFLKKELSNSAISYQFRYTKDIPTRLLTPELFRDCKLILFEATANALKYSQATEFIVDYQLGSELVITISDNGILTDVNSIYNKGNGIGNIIKRTERNSGKYVFYCNAPQGLTIQLRFNWT
jgi:two-component sensor histidine kinase